MDKERESEITACGKYSSLDNLVFFESKYCLWLLHEAVKNGLATHNQETALQSDIINITHSEAVGAGISALNESVVDNMLAGVTFAIDFYLKSLHRHSDALEKLILMGPEVCYKQGRRMLCECALTLKSDTKKAIACLEENTYIKNLCLYRDLTEIAAYAEKVYVPFNAHQELCYSYPPALSVGNQGVPAAKDFVEAIVKEINICLCFDRGDVEQLFYIYNKRYSVNLLESPINIYSVIINNAAFATLYGNKPLSLKISQLESALIAKELLTISGDKAKADKFAGEIAQSLCSNIPYDDGGYTDKYIKHVIAPKIAQRSASSALIAERVKKGEVSLEQATEIIGLSGDLYIV